MGNWFSKGQQRKRIRRIMVLPLEHRANGSHQLLAMCYQRLYEGELRYLRNCYKSFEKQRGKDNKSIPQQDDQFWRVWTDSTTRYATITKSWKSGQTKL